MAYAYSLSQLLGLVQETIETHFYGSAFWVQCEITDVKKYDTKNWCFCKLLEKKGSQVIAEIAGVFWQQGYLHIRRFEQATGQRFESGIKINCLVQVKYHAVYGLKLEVQEIDLSYSLGQMELARQETIRMLLANHPQQIQQREDVFITQNNRLPLPRLIQRIALITANNSDGQRDFLQEITHNQHGYTFRITGFYTTIQGVQAAGFMVKQLEAIAAKKHLFDVVVLVRGGGSQTDLKPFDDYELAKTIALFPLPVLTGIGHDRNTSIADLMARQHKVPTKVAAAIVDHNHEAARQLQLWEDILEQTITRTLNQKTQQLGRWQLLLSTTMPHRIHKYKHLLQLWQGRLQVLPARQTGRQTEKLQVLNNKLPQCTANLIAKQKQRLKEMERLTVQLGPEATLKRGFAMLEQNGAIITSVNNARADLPLIAQLKDGKITTTIENVTTNG
ncbi:MAG: exodeoxyribonuclease VII large subunit [Chitinophagaceae bacterium]|jgi:exodeoxyribonuclease VII large subunit|nr:exodeoxyribonuclease VII large subunit [Chitinophagaceae bacterium]